MPVHALSIGHAIDATVPHVGLVHSAFDRAVNLSLGSRLWTLLDPSQPDLPFGIRAPLDEVRGLGLTSGDPVHVRSGFVRVGSGHAYVVVDCRSTPRWSPRTSGQCSPGIDGRTAALDELASSRWWPGAAEMADRIVASFGQPARLRLAVRDTVGRGPGLTPSGDDVLVGVLAVLMRPSADGRARASASALCRALDEVPASTTSVSLELLHQARSGHVGRALHELVLALAEGPTDEHLRSAATRVVDTGATSGADACAGVLAAARLHLLPTERAAA